MVDEKYQKKLIEIIEKYIPECKIFLFGSRAQQCNTESSDIDIAIDVGRELKSSLLGKIREEIEESTIPYFVDVVDVNNVSDKMKEQIFKYGVLWKD